MGVFIPPKEAQPATIADIKKIYEDSVTKEASFCFATLSSNTSVPVNGNKFSTSILQLSDLPAQENHIL